MGDSSLEDSVTTNQKSRPHLSTKQILISVVSLVATILLCVAAIYYKDYLFNTKYIAQYGLLGMLMTAFLGGSFLSIVAVPVPYWLLVFTLPSILAPQLKMAAPIAVGVTSGFGAGLGQSLTFMIGYGSRDLSQKMVFTFNKNLYIKATDWAQRHGSLAVFFMSAIINPLHLPMTLAMASLRYSGWKFCLFSLVGNMVKSTFIAFCGYFGLTSLFHFLGI